MIEEINPGKRILQLRKNKKMTLKQVSELTGLSVAYLSQVERERTDPSLASLKKIAAALNIKLSDLFSQDEKPHSMVKSGCGNHIFVHGVDCELLASIDKSTMEPLFKFISPKSESGLVEPHDGEEFVLIEEGSLEILIGETVYCLNTGDSIYFKATQAHGWKNISATVPCKALWINNPPLYT